MENYPKYGDPLQPGGFYHIYNSAVGNERLFYSTDNFQYFLDRFHFYTRNVFSVYTFCLLSNYFHFLISVNETADKKTVSEQLRKFFISYSKSYNNYHRRRGTLFNKHLKRVRINNEQQLTWTIYYIHRNPIHHGLTMNYKKYRWSSYGIIVNDSPTKLKRKAVLDIFSGKKEFIEFHERNIKTDILNKRIHTLES